MEQLINGVIRYRNILLFLILFSLSLQLISESKSYTRGSLSHQTTLAYAFIHEIKYNFYSYLKLKDNNAKLANENKLLIDYLLSPRPSPNTIKTEINSAKVIQNNFSLSYNHLIINKGSSDKISPETGVITANGVVGIVSQTSKHYAVVLSLLNKSIRINAKLKKSHHFGSLTWDGKSPQFMTLLDLPIMASVAYGDTIITGGLSTIFPEGIPIGIVVDFNTTEQLPEYKIQLFEDMTALNQVYLTSNQDQRGIQALQKKVNVN